MMNQMIYKIQDKTWWTQVPEEGTLQTEEDDLNIQYEQIIKNNFLIR